MKGSLPNGKLQANMKLTVDRIEGEVIVCVDDNEQIHELTGDMISGDVKESDILLYNDITGKYSVSIEQTLKTKEEARKKFFSLFNKDKK